MDNIDRLQEKLIRQIEYYLEAENIIVYSHNDIKYLRLNYILQRSKFNIKGIFMLCNNNLVAEGIGLLKTLIECWGNVNFADKRQIRNLTYLDVKILKKDIKISKNKCYRNKEYNLKVLPLEFQLKKGDIYFYTKLISFTNLFAHINISGLILMVDGAGRYLKEQDKVILNKIIKAIALYLLIDIIIKVIINFKKEYNHPKYYDSMNKLLKIATLEVINILECEKEKIYVNGNSYYNKRLKIFRGIVQDIINRGSIKISNRFKEVKL